MRFIQIIIPFLLIAFGCEREPRDNFQRGQQALEKKKYTEAIDLFRKAAMQGNSDAMHKLGISYINGNGVPKDLEEGMKWLKRAAELGQTDASGLLGLIYWEAGDKIGAVATYRRAANQGDRVCQYKMGLMCESGSGVQQDYLEALKWYRKSAEQGHPEAQVKLAICYFNGLGVSRDYAESAKWSRKAADQGNADGYWQLSISYAVGQGVPQNDAEWIRLVRLAATGGNKKAAEVLPDLEKFLTQRIPNQSSAQQPQVSERFSQQRPNSDSSRQLEDPNTALLNRLKRSGAFTDETALQAYRTLTGTEYKPFYPEIK